METLAILLRAVDEKNGVATEVIDLGDGVERTLRDAVKQIAPAGLVGHIDRSHLSVSEQARAWLNSGQASDLLAVFHRHVRYVGELLDELRENPRTVRELMEAAGSNYQLEWRTPDQTRRRITWFTCLGLVEYKTSTHIGLTDKGHEHLLTLQLGGPNAVPYSMPTQVTIQEPPKAIADALTALTPEILGLRMPVLGYIPRGNGDTDVVQALTLLVNACSPQISRADLLAYAQETFGVSESSFGAILTTLTRSGLVEQTGFNVYSPTASATAWLENPTALNLALLLHSRVLFFLEIIPLLSEFDQAPQLAKAAVDHYGLQRVDVGGVRTRMQVLKAAGLIYERANWRYQSTPLGDAVAQAFPLQAPTDIDDTSIETLEVQPGGRVESPALILSKELKDASTASENPLRLEKAVADAFTLLGFESRHIGGGGKTDVLATVDGPDLKPVRVIIDAKAARNGTVNEGSVSFDTLSEHKKQYDADFVALVGPSFDSGRVRARAEKNHVSLVTVDELIALLNRHERTPRSAVSFIKLVDPAPGSRRELDSAWAQAERRQALLAHVVAVLAQEAREADEVTNRALSPDQIYLIVRDEIDPRPARKDIEDVLQLLEHPLIASVSRVGTGARGDAFHLVDSPTLVTSKLRSLACTLTTLGTDQ
ncbi:restriction endonuclease [Nocardiopsis aegyptia]|uniref:Restriction endonuclease n=1 Tax=Nocardiopsis aegyptia TaxID=220378 RepID=A0A7Z0EJI3_9ACTN|nr:restriction endonuclease [Nocardiopsis aegyptia]NYJ32365.1 hypothetical protein [Nocardiopsis aegyptia]